MDRSGQVFTLDMFLALALTALMVSYSGLAIEQARRQAEDYALRYSLERTANDAADILVKTLGIPMNWENDAISIITPGFSKEALNLMSFSKIGGLAKIFREWDNANWEDAVGAAKKLFGGLETIEITIYEDNGDEFWKIWPRYDTENSSSENSIETVIVRRLVVANYGENRYSTSPLRRQTGNIVESSDNFWIGEGELEVFDWYLVIFATSKTGLPIEVFINKPSGSPTVKFTQGDYPANPPYEIVWPDAHGGMEKVLSVEENLRENAYNSIIVDLQGVKTETVIVYVAALPACSQPGEAREALTPRPATLEVKLWR